MSLVYLSASRQQLCIYCGTTDYSFGSVNEHVYCSKEKMFLILSDSLSSPQAMYNLKYDHPISVKILELHMELTRDGRETVFIWVPGHVHIRGNSAAKDALDGDIPFLKSRVNKHMLELWQSVGRIPRK